MLNEHQIELLPERIYQRLNDINTEYLKSIGGVIKEIGELRPSDVHKIQQMYRYGSNVDDIVNKLAKVSEKNIEEIYEIFDIVARENYSYAEPFYKAKGKMYIPYEENESLQKYVKSMAKQTVGEYVNLTQHTAFAVFDKGNNIAPLFEANNGKVATSLSETYTKVIDYAVTKVQTGVTDYNSAMRSALKALADSGIRTVDYATGYSRRLDSAVRQNILWGIKECNQNTADMIGEEFGADGYEISCHSHPRPSHEDMGGKTFAIGKARTVNGVYYPSFEEKAESLLREYGCLHFKFSVLLGVSEPAYTKEQLEALKAEDKKTFEFEGKQYTKYEASQMMSTIESKVKKLKDRANIAASAGDEDLRQEVQYKINIFTNKYAQLSKASGLPTKMEKLQVAGFKSIKIADEARFIDNITNWDSLKGDVINPRNIFKNLNKSEVGKSAIDFIVKNNIPIDIYYGKENAVKGVRGVTYGNNIIIYAYNTKTIKCSAETIIHEVTHIERKIGHTQWAEAICFCQERKHTKNTLTISDLRDIIKKVKELYPKYPWR